MPRINWLLCVLLLFAGSVAVSEDMPPPDTRQVQEDSPDKDGSTRHPASVAEIHPYDWTSAPGLLDEIRGQELELRDEIIAAHQAYLLALEKTLTAVFDPDISVGSEEMDWARVEYLLETCYRLLEDTGEYDAFLRVTQPLTPGTVPELPAVPALADDTAADDKDPSGGLSFRDASGNRLVPTPLPEGMALVDATTAVPVTLDQDIVATPTAKIDPAPKPTIPHLLQARVAWLRALALEKTGKSDESRTATANMGLLTNWIVVGTFDNELRGGFDIPLGPETDLDNLDSETRFSGKTGPIWWRRHKSIDPLGRCFPEAIFSPQRDCLAYFLTLVYSPTDRPAVLRIGADGPFAAWVNRAVTRRATDAGVADPDQEATDVWLRAGWNMLLIKTAAPMKGRWRFTARFTNPDGSPLILPEAPAETADLDAWLTKASQVGKRAALDSFYIPAQSADFGGLSSLYSFLGDRRDARANFYLGSILYARRLMEGSERFDRELFFRNAIELSDGNPYYLLAAARTTEAGIEGPDREENLHLRLLTRAGNSGSPAAYADLGRVYLDSLRQPRRAAGYAMLALAANPLSLQAGLLGYDIASVSTQDAVASAILDKLAKRHPEARGVRLRSGRMALKESRYKKALSDFHAILRLDAGNSEALNGAALALRRLDQTSAAIELLDKHTKAFPYDWNARLLMIELYRDTNRYDEQMTALSELLTISPDNPEWLRMRDKAYAVKGGMTPTPAKSAAESTNILKAATSIDYSPPYMSLPEGWEYLVYQVTDRLNKDNSLRRTVTVVVRPNTPEAARNLRQLSIPLNPELEKGTVNRVEMIVPGGRRDRLNSPAIITQSGLRFALPPLSPGVVIEAEVSIERARIPFFGEYFGQIVPLRQRAPIRMARYMFTAERDRTLLFHQTGGAPEPIILESAEDQTITRIWEMRDISGLIPEPDSPSAGELSPMIQMSTFTNWDDFARWYWRVIGPQYYTPPELRAVADRMTREPGKSPAQRMMDASAWVARFLRNREWEQGPHAFRPVSPRAILTRRLADCKDRTLIICLLAMEFGLEASPVLVRTADPRFGMGGNNDFTVPLIDHFNHSLALVTLNGEPVFIDASSPYRPPNEPSASLVGSQAMVLTRDKAIPVTIPNPGVAACSWDEESQMVVDEDGSVLWEQTVKATGAAAARLRSRFGQNEPRDTAWRKFLERQGADISTSQAEFTDSPTAGDEVIFTGRARLRRFATTDGKRMQIRVPQLPGRNEFQLDDQSSFPLGLEQMVVSADRRSDFLTPFPFRITRRLTIQYPANWRFINSPEQIMRRENFGTIRTVVESAPGTFSSEFVFEMPGRRVALEDYQTLRHFAATALRWRHPLFVWEKQ